MFNIFFIIIKCINSFNIEVNNQELIYLVVGTDNIFFSTSNDDDKLGIFRVYVSMWQTYYDDICEILKKTNTLEYTHIMREINLILLSYDDYIRKILNYILKIVIEKTEVYFSAKEIKLFNTDENGPGLMFKALVNR
ncbi:hypothetical protein H311_00969 [Anncaliia algerae PRA109]|nr:hypothetical protein H311_00969 [Anncaliia algerae PRA109]